MTSRGWKPTAWRCLPDIWDGAGKKYKCSWSKSGKRSKIQVSLPPFKCEPSSSFCPIFEVLANMISRYAVNGRMPWRHRIRLYKKGTFDFVSPCAKEAHLTCVLWMRCILLINVRAYFEGKGVRLAGEFYTLGQWYVRVAIGDIRTTEHCERGNLRMEFLH